jgi:hypothetical protein
MAMAHTLTNINIFVPRMLLFLLFRLKILVQSEKVPSSPVRPSSLQAAPAPKPRIQPLLLNTNLSMFPHISDPTRDAGHCIHHGLSLFTDMALLSHFCWIFHDYIGWDRHCFSSCREPLLRISAFEALSFESGKAERG